MFSHLVDILPFIIASAVVLLGPMKLSFNNQLNTLVVFTAFVYLVAQSSWFTAFVTDNPWGRDWANYVWFIFNTCTMVVFSWILFFRKP